MKRVEVIGERTETSSTFALPDGTMSTGQAQGPIWLRTGSGDGTSAADWAPVDPTLEFDDDGTVRPKGHPSDLVIAGEGLPEDELLLSMTNEAGQTVGLQWDEPLPEPRLEGPRAVYPDVQPGVDLVIEVTRTGYEQFFVLTERPEAGAAPDLSVLMRGEGLQPRVEADGGVQFLDEAGVVAGSASTPQLWDAAVDAERRHPIGKPWVAAEGENSAMSPQPDWATPGEEPTPTEPPAPEGPYVGTTPPLPEEAAEPIPGLDDAGLGQAGSAAAVTAQGSPSLPLTTAASVVAPDAVAMELTPDEAFLQDDATEYPVVVDPDSHWAASFDTWGQHGYHSDQSASPELRLGTFDGGATVARSFINLDVGHLRGMMIHSASIDLYEWHAWSCSARNWQVWNTDTAGTWTTLYNQPRWHQHWSTSSQTMGGNACSDGWVGADITGLVHAWSVNGGVYTGLGLKAENERDNFGWKKFNSGNAGWAVPTLWVNYSAPSSPATGLSVLGSVTDAGTVYSSDRTPTLTATAHDIDGAAHLRFRFYHLWGAQLYEETVQGAPDGTPVSVTVPEGIVPADGLYTYEVYSYDWAFGQTGGSVWHTFTIDTTAPRSPFVSSADYPADGEWYGAANKAGAFTLSLQADDPSLAGYDWGLDKAPDTRLSASGTATLSVTPPTEGTQVLQVVAVDKAGNRSGAPVKHAFNVGRAGLVSPVEGAQVVRRVRLQVTGGAELTHVKFVWRRGPDAATTQDVALPALTAANGTPLTSPWTRRSDVGEYATWDAGATLGHVPGPIQVQAVLASDATGAGGYATEWITVTVNPDAQHAAIDSIGPGSVNLLTGDYRLSSTDVDEFGLSLGRTASSRDPRAGLEPQTELLTTAQQTMSSPLTGFHAQSAAIERATNQWHRGNDSLKIISTNGSVDSYAYPGASAAGDITMQPGRTYRVSGWVYVPAANGLDPNSANAPRIVAGSKRQDGTWESASSPRVSKADLWQHLTVDYTVPSGNSAPSIRLYNGFAATNAAVYYDDLSVREIWSPLGPQWSLGLADEAAGTAYTHISQPYPDVAELHFAGGGSTWFTAGGGGKWWPQPGAETLTLTAAGDGLWRLTEYDGTVSEFARQGGTESKLTTTSPPAASGQTRMRYENVGGRVRLERIIAPVEPDVDGAPSNSHACTANVPAVGCEVMQLVYATATTATATAFGAYVDRLVEVKLLSAAGPSGPVDAVTVAKYAYDDRGRLREVWDPRITPQLKTTYEYDSDGRVIALGTPGELPWKFQYGTGGAQAAVGQGDLVDRSSGRLLRVARASLVPGTTDQVGADTTTTLVYAVPLTRRAGGPHDLDAAAISTWAQRVGPTDATAIFGPEDVPSVTTASDTVPGRDGYRAATIHYLDASGREVNTASPAGPDAPAGGLIDTAEYDRYGNVVRSLDATNRLLALGQLPSAATDLAALNLTQADTAARAMALSSLSTYGLQGLDLLRSRGPLVRLSVGNNPDDVQLVHDLTTYAYDEGKPDGTAYHLVTTETTGLQRAGTNGEQPLDAEVTKTGYDPIDGADPAGPTSGWKIGQPTNVTFDAGRANLSALIKYDAQGRAIESRGIQASGTDARTNIAVYYTAGDRAAHPACRFAPAYAGLPCMNYAAGAVTGHDASRMAGELPVRHVTAYNRYGSIVSVTESATGPVAGTTTTVSRTTVTEYDAADRVLSVTITGSGAAAGAPVAKTVNRYDAATGDVTVIEGRDPAGAVVSTVKKSFDLLGRMTRYEDGSGGWTTSVFDRFGKPTEVADSTGATTSFTYDRAKEPRGFVTSVTDSVGGTVSASYGPDGQVTEQVLPGGVALRIGYDANRTPITRTYARTADNGVIATSAALENAAGQMVTHATPAATKRYSYDALGRLTSVRDSITGTSVCVARTYAYTPRGNRQSLATAISGTGSCVDPMNPGGTPASTTSYTYDTADRLVTESTVDAAPWVYDPLGRITTAPVRGSPGSAVVNDFFVNDLIAAQTIEGVARQTWSLDAIGRFSSYTNQAWAVGGDGNAGWQEAVTKVNHYDSDSDSPAWIAEDASLPDEITRYVDGLDGNLAMETGKAGNRVLQLIDLHGDVMTTLPIRDGENTADWSAMAHQTADEFGNPTDLTTGIARVSDGSAPGKDGRYGWLGGKQRSADALAGVILMGVRLYDPATGRFWSRDPVPGGNSTAYDYCSGDPVNCTDLDGQWGFFKNLVKRVAKKVAKVAEVVATVVPGPIGAAAAAISAGAYAATGNRAKALEMGVTALAAMVPGGGAMAKAGFAAARAAGRVAAKAGQSLSRLTKRGCNSFTPETDVLMADGTTQPISDVEVGDLVKARDPVTGELTAQPVLNVIVGHGDKHLIGVTTSRAPPSGYQDALPPSPDLDTWTATANHPVWVQGAGWTDAEDLELGDQTVGDNGTSRTIVALADFGWIPEQTVFNLSVANAHTFVVGAEGVGALVHNTSACQIHAPRTPRGPGVYTITFADGEKYVGRSFDMRKRINSHFHANGKFNNRLGEVTKITCRRGPRDLATLMRREQARMDQLTYRGIGLKNLRREIAR